MVLGAQCYTVRALMQSDEGIDESLKKIAEMGYTAIQASGFTYEPAFLRECADRYGLKIELTHNSPQRILEDTKNLIAEHEVIGCKRIGLGAMPDMYRGSIEAVRGFIADFTPAMNLIAEKGMKFYYHNHAFEYEKLCKRVMLDILADETAPELMGFTLDTYWTQLGGRNVVRQFEMLRGRVDVCHFKDVAVIDGVNTPVPILEGNLCWEEILFACEGAGVKYAFVEVDDCPAFSPMQCLKQSIVNINRAGWNMQ